MYEKRIELYTPPYYKHYINYENFANAVNQAYPNKIKHLHQNYSVNVNGLFYVTVEQGTTVGSTKTLVVGNENGILATKDVTVSGFAGVSRTPFACHTYFGFTGRNGTGENNGRDTYISLFHYNNITNTITNIYTSTSINIKNYITGDMSCFFYKGKYWFQCVSNSTYNTLVFYDLSSHTTSYVRNESTTFKHVGGAVITTDENYIYYLIAPRYISSSTYSYRINQIYYSVNMLMSSTMSNTISTFDNTYNFNRNYPVINDRNKMIFSSDASGYKNKFYQSVYSSDYSSLQSPVYLRDFFSNIYYTYDFIIQCNENSSYDVFYCDPENNYNIIKVQSAFTFN